MNKKISSLLLVFLSLIAIVIFNYYPVIADDNLNHNKPPSNQIVKLADFIAQQQNFEAVEIKTIPVKNNLYMLMGEGGNIGLSVGEDGALLIDSQFSGLTDKITQAINKINQQPIRYLINTHYHFDHTNGNENFANLGAVIIAHENVPKQMKIDHSYAVLGMEIPASTGSALPVMTFNDSLDLDFNNNQIHAFYVPFAHTDGDIIIHFKQENVIHTGDLYFNGFYPFIDTQVGGSVEGMIKGIDQILSLCNEETLIMPGHGELSKRLQLIEFQNMLKTVNQRVKDALSKNMNLDAMIKANLLADLDAKWGKGFLNSEQFVTITYQGLTKAK